jgi:hypothetical protein
MAGVGPNRNSVLPDFKTGILFVALRRVGPGYVMHSHKVEREAIDRG